MANKEVVFSDRMMNLSIQNGLVRIDLGVIAGTGKGKDDKPAVKVEATHQLVMPLDGFLAGVAMQDKVVKELVARQKKRKAVTTEPKLPGTAS